MVNLEEIREKIDKIDKQIVELYEERMKLTEQVAEYKITTGKKVYDREREESKLEVLSNLAGSDFSKQSIVELFEQIMAVSRKRQYQMIAATGSTGRLSFSPIKEFDFTGKRIVYQGVEGAYSQQALLEFFGDNTKAEPVDTWRDAMEMIRQNKADYAVLPIENSSAGIVSENYDLLMEYDHCIVGEQIIHINHCLMGLPDAGLSDVRHVYSHMQALMQCSRYLEKHREWDSHEIKNTAMSAMKVRDDGNRENAAIAASITAEIYGLKILDDQIQNNQSNSTRFIIVTGSKIFETSARKISICFEIPHHSGSLYRSLSHFIFNNLNMNRIESRPVPGKKWEYRFFVDFEGNLQDGAVQNALVGLKQETEEFKILGNYNVKES